MLKCFNWINKKFPQFIDFNEGQAENSSNNNLWAAGKPRTGKNYFTDYNLEPLLNGDYAKAIIPHCANEEHLQEVAQFLFPNGFFLERDVHQQLDTLRTNLRNAEYENHELVAEDLLDIEDIELAPRINYLQDLEEQADNTRVERRLRDVRKSTEAILKKIEKIEQNVLNEDRLDHRFRNAIAEGGPTSNFTMKIYTPISRGMPTDVEIPGLFQPFAIPVDAFVQYDDVEWSLKIVFGDQNFESYNNLYQRLCEPGNATFADLKVGVPEKERDHVETVTYGDGQTVEVYNPGESKQSLKRFRTVLGNWFNKRGLVSSSNFEQTLRDQLKEDLLSDDPQIIVLYTGFLKDSEAKKFVMTYFMETYKSIISKLDPDEERQLDRKFILKFLEAQDAIKKSTQDNNLSDADKNFNRFMGKFLDKCQHLNTDAWVDTKPDNAHPMLKSRANHSVITQINHDDLRELFGGRPKEVKQAAKRAMKDPDYTKDEIDGVGELGYGFIDIGNEDIIDWQKPPHARYYPGRKTYGYRLPSPRQCVEQPIRLSNQDFSFLIDALDLDDEQTFTFQQYQDTLFKEDWEQAESEPIEREDRKLEAEKEQQREEEEEKSSLLQETFCEKLEKKFIENGRQKPGGGWRDWLREIAKEMDLDKTIKTYENWTKELRDELESSEGQQVDVDVEPSEIADELKRDPKFVLACRSEGRKLRHAQQYLQDEHGLTASEAEAVAEDAVGSAIDELIFDGIIDQSHRPLVDGDSMEEMKQNFREIMGLNQQDAPEGEDDSSVEPPGEEWSCDCGTLNDGDRTVCRNPRCTKSHADISDS